MAKLSPKNLRIAIIILLVMLAALAAKRFMQLSDKAKADQAGKDKKGISSILDKVVPKKPVKPEIAKGKEEKKSTQIPSALEQLLGQSEQEKIPIRVYKVAKTDFQDELPIMGTIKSIPEIDLKFEINGRISEIRFKEGQKVRKGDLIARLDQKDALLELSWAQAKLNSARAETEAVKKRNEVIEKLYQTGAIIEARVEEARAEVKAAVERAKVAEVEIESSKARLEKTNLYAPTDGIMGLRDMDESEFITPQDRIATLLSEANIFVEVGIIEKDIYKVQLGQRVIVNVDAYSKTDFYGIVESIFPILEGKTRTLNVRIKLIESRGLLLPGMFARTRIYIYSKKGAIIVPSSSLTIEGKRYFVATISDDKVKNKEISVEYITSDYAVLKTGLNEADLVVIETPGLKKLKDGTPVEIIETQEKLNFET